ncbi:MAG: NAD(+) diphosphatase [Acidobacteriota bacterium]
MDDQGEHQQAIAAPPADRRIEGRHRASPRRTGPRRGPDARRQAHVPVAPRIVSSTSRVLKNPGWHFPRTDPAVIVRVVHDERILLGRQGTWPADRRSVLAGVVEPGEGLEDAVAREVGEEAGVAVGAVRYVGSQPWPFPASLMLAFVAEAEDDRLCPQDEELADLGWWSRGRVRREQRDGSLRLPPETSISRWLIDGWLGDDRRRA